jgi:hypothetical protein
MTTPAPIKKPIIPLIQKRMGIVEARCEALILDYSKYSTSAYYLILGKESID